MTNITLPEIKPEYEPTRATLHAYALALGALTRTRGVPHPKWWHLGLKVRHEGLATDPLPLPDGGSLAITMDLRHHEIVLRSSTGWELRSDLRSAGTGTELADRMFDAVSELGLEGPYDRSRFENDDPRTYDPAAAEVYFEAFVAVNTIFERRRLSLGDRVSPIQVWPHGFDLAFDWFGSRIEEEGGERVSPEVNLGFYPGGIPYFYSNPWPFDSSLVGSPLPHGAQWHLEGWQGTMLPYAAVRAGDAATRLLDYARAVFDLATPGLGV